MTGLIPVPVFCAALTTACAACDGVVLAAVCAALDAAWPAAFAACAGVVLAALLTVLLTEDAVLFAFDFALLRNPAWLTPVATNKLATTITNIFLAIFTLPLFLTLETRSEARWIYS